MHFGNDGYESRRYAENRIHLDAAWRDAMVIGPEAVVRAIVRHLDANRRAGRALRVAFEG